MHAFLITGGSEEDQKKQEHALIHAWNVSPSDVFQITRTEEKSSLGIDVVRQLSRFLSLSPRLSSITVAVIEQAENLTKEAQHALLKTLEEPPHQSRIILKACDASTLLPTILSRCLHIHISSQQKIAPEQRKQIEETLHTFDRKRVGEICQNVDRIFQKKEQAGDFFSTLIRVGHENLQYCYVSRQKKEELSGQTNETKNMLYAAITAQNQLSANVNYLLVLDAFFFAISLYKPRSLMYNKSIE